MVRSSRTYGLDTPLEEMFPKPIVSNRAPTSNDLNFEIGQVWINKSLNNAYIFTSSTAGNATWNLMATGSGDLEQLTGDTGGAALPTAGNINVLGGLNINTVVSGSDLTTNLDPSLSGLTSITSTTVNATTLDTNVDTAAVTLSGTTLAADGTDADIDITLTPQGTGNIDVSSGNVDIQAGNLALTGAATQLQVEGGAVTDFVGSATLQVPGGDVTIANTNIAANDLIFIQRTAVSSTMNGFLSYTINPGVSFTITSSDSTDDSSVVYFIVRQL